MSSKRSKCTQKWMFLLGFLGLEKISKEIARKYNQKSIWVLLRTFYVSSRIRCTFPKVSKNRCNKMRDRIVSLTFALTLKKAYWAIIIRKQKIQDKRGFPFFSQKTKITKSRFSMLVKNLQRNILHFIFRLLYFSEAFLTFFQPFLAIL